MLTIERLDEIKKWEPNSSRLRNNKCFTPLCKSKAELYLYSTHLIYWECPNCLERDNIDFPNTKKYKLSEKEIFYLLI